MPDLNEYVAEKLKADGYTGLYNGDTPCGCSVENLGPCCETPWECEPGYRRDCKDCPRFAEKNCPLEDGGNGPDCWCVSPNKEGYPEAYDGD